MRRLKLPPPPRLQLIALDRQRQPLLLAVQLDFEKFQQSFSQRSPKPSMKICQLLLLPPPPPHAIKVIQNKPARAMHRRSHCTDVPRLLIKNGTALRAKRKTMGPSLGLSPAPHPNAVTLNTLFSPFIFSAQSLQGAFGSAMHNTCQTSNVARRKLYATPVLRPARVAEHLANKPAKCQTKQKSGTGQQRDEHAPVASASASGGLEGRYHEGAVIISTNATQRAAAGHKHDGREVTCTIFQLPLEWAG